MTGNLRRCGGSGRLRCCVGCRCRLRGMRVRLSLLLAVALVALAGSATSASSPQSGLTRLVAPPDGRSHFGFTFPLFDTTEPVWGDGRPFADRIGDAIQVELAGKTPTFVTVWAPWQYPDQPGKPLVPFGAVLGDISKVRSVVGDGGVIYLDWNIASTTFVNYGITTRDIAAGKLDRYIRRYARDVRE